MEDNEDSKISYYNAIFNDGCLEKINIKIKRKSKTEDVIKEYFKRINKTNLLVQNIDNIYFISNGKMLNSRLNETLESLFNNLYYNFYCIDVINGRENDYNYEIISTIKENVLSSVFKAKRKSKFQNNSNQNKINQKDDEEDFYVAIKKIYKDKIKDEIKFNLVKKELTEEDFKSEIEKYNKELDNMQKCQCENSVDIYDYYDKDNEFTIIMELCDDTLFHELCRKKKGFSSNEIKEILLQLNKVFKRMNYYNISHRDIKLNNILIKYLDKEKTKYKVLLSDYGISNKLYSITQKFTTHAGSKLMMAPEILNDEEYNNKCDLWSLGIIIFQLYKKNFPYKGKTEKEILKEIEEKGQSVLDAIDPNDKLLKDLLSKLLVKDPNKRISWDDYFEHSFFKDN